MSRKVILVAVLVMLLALPVAVYAQETDPLAVTEGFVAAANAGDVAAASALVADDAVATAPQAMSGEAGQAGTDPAVQQVYEGKAKIEAWLEGQMSANAETTLGECVVEGEIVICDAKFKSDALAAMGIAELEGELKIQVNAEGLIQAYNFTASAESVAEVQAASAAGAAAAAAPETIAVTGGGNLLPYALVIVLGGLLMAGGLGVQTLQRRSRRVY